MFRPHLDRFIKIWTAYLTIVEIYQTGYVNYLIGGFRCVIWHLIMRWNICHDYISVKWRQWVRLLQPQGDHGLGTTHMNRGDPHITPCPGHPIRNHTIFPHTQFFGDNCLITLTSFCTVKVRVFSLLKVIIYKYLYLF